MGRLSEVTVLFADARGFTALIHERGPEEITPFIDEFFRRCANIVVSHDGIIDNFRGDAVLGFFNVPVKRDDHIARAIAAATEIQQAVPDINLAKGEEQLLKIGIGITTGIALTTTVGSDSCKDYTVMGDVANIAIGAHISTLFFTRIVIIFASINTQKKNGRTLNNTRSLSPCTASVNLTLLNNA